MITGEKNAAKEVNVTSNDGFLVPSKTGRDYVAFVQMS